MTPREQASAQTARQPAWPGVIWMPWETSFCQTTY